MHGPFQVLGNPHPSDENNTSFHSQITSVFKVPGKKDLYIALADRWLPEHMNLSYDTYSQIFESMFKYGSREEALANATPEALAFADNMDIESNTAIADYVWLPIRFDGEMAYIDWKDEWRIEDFE